MNNQDETMVCPRCGHEFSVTSRCCIKCGYMNPIHPSNKEYLNKYSQEKMEEYSVSRNSGDIMTKITSIKSGNTNLAFSKNVGNFTLCFFLNFFIYLLIVIGIILFYYHSSADIYKMLGSDLSYVLLIFTAFSLFQYSIQLVYMKMNKRWIFSLIPFVNMYSLSDALTHNKWMNILVFIPVIGQVYLLYLLYKMGQSFKKSGLLTMLLPIIMIPIIGFGEASFHGIFYISELDSLETEYSKKRLYWVVSLIVFVASIGMIIYSNIVHIHREVGRFSSYSLYYASKKL